MGAVCGGFICTKNALTALNSIYILVGIMLMAVGGVAKGSSIITSIPAVAGIIASGVFLFAVALLGLYGSSKHHQVILFFYMITLFLIFLIQFFVAVACLAISKEQIQTLVQSKWNQTHSDIQLTAMKQFHCCPPGTGTNHREECYSKIPFCSSNPTECKKDCQEAIPTKALRVVHVAGGISLFFSFSEIVGIWLAMRFRNLKNPKADPNLFL